MFILFNDYIKISLLFNLCVYSPNYEMQYLSNYQSHNKVIDKVKPYYRNDNSRTNRTAT